jgi:predicted flap endonuclease-1-like 5' DNA nuclease
LHALGVTTFAQIGKWNKADIAKFDDAIKGPTRIEHDNWISQAKALASGKVSEHAAKVKAGKST